MVRLWALVNVMVSAVVLMAAGTMAILGVSTMAILPLIGARSMAPVASVQVLLLVMLREG